MNTIAERISQRRKELGLTQKELAEKLHVSDKTVSRWETDRQIPDALTMQDIAGALGMTVSEIYGTEKAGRGQQAGPENKSFLLKKIRKIFCAGLAAAAAVIILGLCAVNYGLGSGVSCAAKIVPMYKLTHYDHSVVDWIEGCKLSGKEINHTSSLRGGDAYYLFYLPRGCEETQVKYSYHYSLSGKVLKLHFKNTAEPLDQSYYLCYLKLPYDDGFYLETYLDGEPVDSGGRGHADFVRLCEYLFG